ncbi:hypothetical protein [Paenibacillus sp. L3-i20]|uniref:hypothetical protein n=1 Tax=Paenibacillus sp. L3-i20 TaxID=2905833 RepID=UPI001EE11836|nr:hypothetical protein [Paenibacillus sp. L3-i20]GKU78897.1 hypothetical protein L3i20_v232940 [Paenibacillus sp. L3-i20]
MSKNIEIFTDRLKFGDEIINKVSEYACSKCVITVYDINNADDTNEMHIKTNAYGINKLPAVTFDGKVVNIEMLKGGHIRNIFQHLIGRS